MTAPNEAVGQVGEAGWVLAVLDGWIGLIRHQSGSAPNDLTEARAAIAELIEAALQMNGLAKGPSAGVTQKQKQDAIGRMDAALRAVGAAK